MKRLVVTYNDGTTETVDYYGYYVVRDGVLTAQLTHGSGTSTKYRSWPLTALRSWVDA